MKSKNIKIFICDFCGFMSESEQVTKLHEECCPKNPKNLPCSQCSNLILGIGCSRGKNIDDVGGNVLCFFYTKGTPINPFINSNNSNNGGAPIPPNN